MITFFKKVICNVTITFYARSNCNCNDYFFKSNEPNLDYRSCFENRFKLGKHMCKASRSHIMFSYLNLQVHTPNLVYQPIGTVQNLVAG